MRSAAVAVIAGFCLLAAPALANKRPYSTGRYAGQIDERGLGGYKTPVQFSVAAGAITKLKTTVTVVCYGGDLTDDKIVAPRGWRVKIGRGGHFAFHGTIGSSHVVFTGTVKGKRATGRFDDSYGSGQTACTAGGTAMTTFTAKLR